MTEKIERIRPEPRHADERRTCYRKASFRTRQQARRARSSQGKKNGRLEVYKCPYCGEYHLGRSSWGKNTRKI